MAETSKTVTHPEVNSNNLPQLLSRTVFCIITGAVLGAFLISTVLKIGYFVTNLPNPLPPYQLDFAAFYTAAAILNSENPVLYDEQAAKETARQVFGEEVLIPPYIYPPFFAWLLRPLAKIPYQPAIVIWLFINIMLTIMFVKPLARIAGLPPKPLVLLVLFLLVWIFPLTGQTAFNVGQVNILMLFLLILIIDNVSPGKSPQVQWISDLIAGIALGFAVGIKLFFAVLIIYFWFYRRKRLAAVAIITFLVTILFGFLAAGIENSWVYITRVLPQLQDVEPGFKWYNYAIAPTVERMFDQTTLTRGFFFAKDLVEIQITPITQNPDLGLILGKIALFILGVGIAAVFIFDWKSNRKNPAVRHDIRVALLILAVMLCMPLSWSHSFVLVLVPFAFLIVPNQSLRIAWWVRYLILICTAGLLLINLHWNYIYYILGWKTIPFWVLATGTLGILILVILLAGELLLRNKVSQQFEPITVDTVMT